MPGFITVVHDSPQTIWCPMSDAVTLYQGQIVMHDTSGPLRGVEPLDDASGAFNLSNSDVPFGVVIGNNLKNKLYDGTYGYEYITSPAAADPYGGSANEYTGVEGPWAKGDPVAMVKVALITPSTILSAPIYSTTPGNPLTVLTVTTSCGGDGIGCTTNATQFTPIVSNMNTIYCRTGGNAGTYRNTDSTSTTVHTWDIAMRNTVAVGDTFVMAPVRMQGFSTVQFDADYGNFIEGQTSPAVAGTNLWAINVIRLDLSEAGKEYCEFMFSSIHFAYNSPAT